MAILQAQDLDFPGPGERRVTVDTAAGTIRFEQCHWPSGFLTFRWDPERTMPLKDVVSAREAGGGEQKSLWIKTETGRCRVFVEWENYAQLRQLLAEFAPPDGEPWYSSPKLIPVYATIGVIILTVLLFWLA